MENVSESGLSFRRQVNTDEDIEEFKYEPGDFRAVRTPLFSSPYTSLFVPVHPILMLLDSSMRFLFQHLLSYAIYTPRQVSNTRKEPYLGLVS